VVSQNSLRICHFIEIVSVILKGLDTPQNGYESDGGPDGIHTQKVVEPQRVGFEPAATRGNLLSPLLFFFDNMVWVF
jgi:hypothetical protein